MSEIIAGLTTFSTMVYIIFINPQILSQTGMDFDAVMVATIIGTAFATLVMGLRANYPFAVAPGMGLNAYFAYGIVIKEGYSWEVALGACLIASVIFLIMGLLSIREKIMHSIPNDLRIGTAAGIGLFLAFIGLQSVDVVISHHETLLTLGNMQDVKILLSALGLILMTAMMARGIQGSIFFAIAIIWVLGLSFGLIEWQGFFSMPPSIAPTLLKLDIMGALTPAMLPIIATLVFVILFDAAGTLLALGKQGNFLDAEGKLPRANRALNADALGTFAGSLLGTSPFTTYLESATGVAAGGRTGKTAVVVALLFLCTLFVAPFAASVPTFATAPALVLIGALMLGQAKHFNWEDPTEYIPGFITLVAIPMTFSIASGIALGFITFTFVKLLSGRARDVSFIVWILTAIFTLRFVFI